MPRPHLKLLERDEIELIHEKATDLLEDLGVLIDNNAVISLFKEIGVNVKGKLVLVPKDLVRKALGKIKREITLYDREGKPYASLKGDSSYFNPGSTATKLLDYEENSIREPVMEDLVKLAILVDSLEHISLQSTAQCQVTSP